MKKSKVRLLAFVFISALIVSTFGACNRRDSDASATSTKTNGNSGGERAQSSAAGESGITGGSDPGTNSIKSGGNASSRKTASTLPTRSGGNIVIENPNQLPTEWKPNPEVHTYYNTAHQALDPYWALPVDMHPFGEGKGVGYNAQYRGDEYIKAHEEAALRRSDGQYVNYTNQPIGVDSASALPTKGYTDYYISKILKGIDEGARKASIVEVGVFGFSGYEQAFRDEWKAAYGTNWFSFWSDPSGYFMAQDLRNKMGTTQVRRTFEAVKAKKSSVATRYGNHSSTGYYGFGVSVGNADIAALVALDEIEGEVWSNTIRQAFTYNGVSAAQPFVNGLFDYGYFAQLGRANNKKIYAITDPKGDGSTNWSLELCYSLYRHQIAAMMAHSSVYRYNVCEWPERAYTGTSPLSTPAFKTTINNVISMQNQMYKYQKPIQTANAPVKVGVLTMDAACYQAGGPDGGASFDDMFGMFSGLMMNGLIVDSIPFGTSAAKNDIFKEYDVIIASYDTMKPLNKLSNEKLEAFVKNGGTVLFYGGKGTYEDISLGWWKQAGYPSPQDELFHRLGIAAAGRAKNQSGTLIPASGSAIASKTGNISTGSNKAIVYDSVSGASAMYTLNGKIAGFTAKAGKGNFIYLGMDPKAFCAKGMGDVQFRLAQAIASQHFGKNIAKKNSISYRRGPWYGISALSGNVTTETGKFIDLFDEKLTVIDKKTVQGGESAFLLDVSEQYKNNYPTVLFAPGTNPTICEFKNITRVVTNGPQDSTGTIRIYLPDGYRVKSVSAKDILKRDRIIGQKYDSKTKSLLVTYKNHYKNIIVDVEYSY